MIDPFLFFLIILLLLKNSSNNSNIIDCSLTKNYRMMREICLVLLIRIMLKLEEMHGELSKLYKIKKNLNVN